jgi:hypothetical protein
MADLDEGASCDKEPNTMWTTGQFSSELTRVSRSTRMIAGRLTAPAVPGHRVEPCETPLGWFTPQRRQPEVRSRRPFPHFATWGWKMKVFSLVEGVIMKLGMIPGLSFLHGYVTQLHGKHTEFYQTIDDYQGYVRSARDAASDVAGAARKSKQDEEIEADDDDVTYEDDYEEDDDESYLQ